MTDYPIHLGQAESDEEKHGCLTCCLVYFGIAATFISVVVLVIFYGLSGLSKPIDLGVAASYKDFDSFMQKIDIKMSSAVKDYCFTCDVVFDGSHDADISLTNEEATAWFTYPNERLVYFNSTQVKLEEDKVLVATNFEYGSRSFPLLLTGVVSRTGEQSLRIHVETIKVGFVSFPAEYIPQVEEYLNSLLRDRLQRMNGFKVDSLEFEEGRLLFKGSLPNKVSETN